MSEALQLALDLTAIGCAVVASVVSVFTLRKVRAVELRLPPGPPPPAGMDCKSSYKWETVMDDRVPASSRPDPPFVPPTIQPTAPARRPFLAPYAAKGPKRPGGQ